MDVLDKSEVQPALPVALLVESLAWIEKQDIFAEMFYDRLFELDEEVRKLFDIRKTDWNRQKKALMSALAVVVAALKRGELAALQTTLHQLGKKHQEYGVQPSYFPTVGRALLDTFPAYLYAQGMGDHWTPAHHEAWMQSYSAVQALMLEGYVPSPLPHCQTEAPR